MLCVDYVTLVYKKYDCQAKMEICVFVSKIKKKKILRSVIANTDSNICIVQQQQQFWIENNKCTIWKHERQTQLSLFIQA